MELVWSQLLFWILFVVYCLSRVWVQYLNRAQTILKTFHIPLTLFQHQPNQDGTTFESDFNMTSQDEDVTSAKKDATTEKISLLYEDRSDVWINVSSCWNWNIFLIFLMQRISWSITMFNFLGVQPQHSSFERFKRRSWLYYCQWKIWIPSFLPSMCKT